MQKIWLKTIKNPQCSLAKLERERGKFEKVDEQVKSKFFFKKKKKNLIHDVRLIEKQVQSIEPGKGSLKFFKRISIDRKSNWINRKSEKKKHLFRKSNLNF